MEGTRPWQPAVHLRPHEYLQITAELGLVGLALLAVLVVAIAPMLWRARPTGHATAATWVGWSRRRQPSPSTAASTLSGTCQPSCSP